MQNTTMGLVNVQHYMNNNLQKDIYQKALFHHQHTPFMNYLADCLVRYKPEIIDECIKIPPNESLVGLGEQINQKSNESFYVIEEKKNQESLYELGESMNQEHNEILDVLEEQKNQESLYEFGEQKNQESLYGLGKHMKQEPNESLYELEEQINQEKAIILMELKRKEQIDQELAMVLMELKNEVSRQKNKESFYEFGEQMKQEQNKSLYAFEEQKNQESLYWLQEQMNQEPNKSLCVSGDQKNQESLYELGEEMNQEPNESLYMFEEQKNQEDLYELEEQIKQEKAMILMELKRKEQIDQEMAMVLMELKSEVFLNLKKEELSKALYRNVELKGLLKKLKLKNQTWKRIARDNEIEVQKLYSSLEQSRKKRAVAKYHDDGVGVKDEEGSFCGHGDR